MTCDLNRSVCDICAFTGDETGACLDCDGLDNFALDGIHSAAKELLEALEKAEGWIDAHDADALILIEIRDTIAKAKGETP